MVIHVLPLKRLPRRFSTFDYTVPKGLESKLQIGQLISIPFRKSIIFGLVFDIKKSTDTVEDSAEKLKEIIGIIHEIPLVPKNYIQFIQDLSALYGTSTSVVAHMGLLPLQKNKLKKIVLNRTSRQEHKRTSAKPPVRYHLYTTENEHRSLYTKIIQEKKGQTLVIVPEVRHIAEVESLLSDEQKKKTVTWYSELSTKEKFTRWLQIHNQEKHLIIGTRSAILLPFLKLNHIIIDFEHDENIKHWDQNPRFHTKDVAELVAGLHHAKLTHASFSPSFESYYGITKKQIACNKSLSSQSLLFDRKESKNPHQSPIIVNMSYERNAGKFSVFSQSAADALEHLKNTGHDAFIFINRKGYATSVGCNDCGYIETDETTGLPMVYREDTNLLHSAYSNVTKPMPLVCPRCSSPVVRMLGMGTELVEHDVRRMFGSKATHAIMRIDGSTEVQDIPACPKVIIGTEMALQFVSWQETDLIIFLDIDRQLALPEFNAIDYVWHMIQEVQYRRIPKSAFYLQTVRPEHVVCKSLNEEDRIYRTELSKRKTAGYPPYTYLARYYCGADTLQASARECDIIRTNVLRELTKNEKQITISPCFEMQPRYFRTKYWHGFVVKCDPKHWQEEITWLNQYIPETWKIDPNPISLLSP